MEVFTSNLIIRDIKESDVSFDIAKYLIEGKDYKKDFGYTILDKNYKILGYILIDAIDIINDYKKSNLIINLDNAYLMEVLPIILEDAIINNNCIKIIIKTSNKDLINILKDIGFVFDSSDLDLEVYKITKPLFKGRNK